MNEYTDIQLQIVGCIYLEDYAAAAQLVKDYPVYIEFAMQLAFRDGYREAVQTFSKLTTGAMSAMSTEKTRMLK